MSAAELTLPATPVIPGWKKLMRVWRRVFVMLRRRSRRARMFTDLSRLDDRLLYDLGIDPLDVRGGLEAHRDRLGLIGLAMRLGRS